MSRFTPTLRCTEDTSADILMHCMWWDSSSVFSIGSNKPDKMQLPYSFAFSSRLQSWIPGSCLWSLKFPGGLPSKSPKGHAYLPGIDPTEYMQFSTTMTGIVLLVPGILFTNELPLVAILCGKSMEVVSISAVSHYIIYYCLIKMAAAVSMWQ